jgi:muramoyltetrapeptide carboxypeptidase
MTIFPPYLKKGDTIAITCPSGFMPYNNATKCIETLQKWGFQVLIGNTLKSKSTNYFSAPDEEKIEELQAMLDANNIQAILFGRGGYGMSRIIDQLNFSKFKKNPKWLIGFSDLTLIHSHVLSNLNIATIHGPMSGAFNPSKKQETQIDALHKMITGKKNRYDCNHFYLNRVGKAEGTIIGGNLSLLANGIGTKSDISTKNKILFIEDIGEYLYSIDRMLQQLKRSGKLQYLSGLVVGGFTDMKDTDRPYGKKIEEIIFEIVKEYDYPVCFHFPVSHGTENYPIKIGAVYSLAVTKKKSTLIEK